MKQATVLTFTLLLLTTFVAQASSLCVEKEQNIQRKITHAKQHNNPYPIAGLKKALREVQTHCTDSKLIAEHQEKFRQQKIKVATRQSELDKARQKGDPEKIAKREKKLAEAEAELKLLNKQQY